MYRNNTSSRFVKHETGNLEEKGKNNNYNVNILDNNLI